MAACNVKVHVDNRDKVYTGGDRVTGRVTITCENDVNCKGLEISTKWYTHGRGNVTGGVGASTTAFAGKWLAGQTYEYPFDLSLATWPPTYNGTYLNVSHVVHAQAKLPWKFDPKASEEVIVYCPVAPEGLAPPSKQMGPIVKVLVALFVSIIAVAIIFWLMFFGVFIVLAVGIYWFFRVFLPKRLLGNVTATFQPNPAAPGELMVGEIAFTPRKNLTVNGISCKLQCVEEVSSGSGSNRKTYRHFAVDKSFPLGESNLQLVAGKEQKLAFDYPLPMDAAPSMKLTDNQLKWSAIFRVDIPKWPDWTKTIEVVVKPSPVTPGTGTVDQSRLDRLAQDRWFEDVANQLKSVADDREKLELVLDAIEAEIFTVSLDMVEPLTEATEKLPFDEPGSWYVGLNERADSDIAVFFPAGSSEPDMEWRGNISLVDFDGENDRIIARMTP